MAGSRFAYVKNYELPDPLLPGTFLVVRVDGHGFRRFTDVHGFEKPNDERALKLMDRAACAIMDEYKDVVLAFGESDEYSFLLRRSTALYNRRQAKILTTFVSLFTSSYVLHWAEFFPDKRLVYAPSFDGRVIPYPSEKEARDYFAWRQTDTHINNLYNTTFWALVQQGRQSAKEAHETLRGTVSSEKHDILFSRYGINYNHMLERYRKGSVLVREQNGEDGRITSTSREGEGVDVKGEGAGIGEDGTNAEYGDGTTDRRAEEGAGGAQKRAGNGKGRAGKKATRTSRVAVMHCDVIGDGFWRERGWLLAG